MNVISHLCVSRMATDVNIKFKNLHSEDYEKFKKLSGLLFQDEPCLDIGYRVPPAGHIYKFLRASEHYNSTLYALYQFLSL